MSNPKQRYLIACHAIQSGVAAKMEIDPSETTPKHLRTGINISMCDNSALAQLLISKGIITMEEYEESLAKLAEQEVASYEKQLSGYLGKPVKLH